MWRPISRKYAASSIWSFPFHRFELNRRLWAVEGTFVSDEFAVCVGRSNGRQYQNRDSSQVVMINRLRLAWNRYRAKLRGWFHFAGARVYMPPAGTWASTVILRGYPYEPELSALCAMAAREGTTVFDVGANIGISALPLLAAQPKLRVVSFEASPKTLTCLVRTHAESPYADRWEIMALAVADKAGEKISFHVNPPGHDALDGIRDTHRSGGQGHTVEVVTTTLDREWQNRDRPIVSLVKVDVEGAEPLVFAGASALIEACRPTIVCEWCLANLKAYQTDPTWILEFSAHAGYQAYLIPGLVPAIPHVFRYQLALAENLLLVPEPTSLA